VGNGRWEDSCSWHGGLGRGQRGDEALQLTGGKYERMYFKKPRDGGGQKAKGQENRQPQNAVGGALIRKFSQERAGSRKCEGDEKKKLGC